MANQEFIAKDLSFFINDIRKWLNTHRKYLNATEMAKAREIIEKLEELQRNIRAKESD